MMKLFKRMADLLSANLHDLIDHWDDPERMLRQAVREIEDACDTALEATAKAIAQERILHGRRQSLQSQVDRCHDRATAAISAGNEAVAREAVAAKLRHRELLDQCAAQYCETSQTAAGLRAELQQLRSRLAEARNLYETYAARHRMTQARRTVTRRSQTISAGQQAFGRLRRACETIDREEAESVAVLELCDDVQVAMTEFDADVELELKVLRAEAEAAAAEAK